MENMNNLVTEVTENVEPTTEEVVEVEQPKVYTEEELNQRVDEIVGKRIRRKEAKIRKEYDRKYGNLEQVLRAGTGEETVEGMTGTFRKFYESKGIKMPTEPTYSEKDTSILARAEAEDIINAGFEDVIEEVDRLAEIGLENMSSREREVFGILANYRQNTEQSRDLERIGVTKDVYDSKEFKDFAKKFDSTIPVTEIYEIYNKMQPQKEIKSMGSMKSGNVADKGVKEFYSRDEALQFTKKDFDNNPELFKAVERSMLKW
jgi:ClpP class serine protease